MDLQELISRARFLLSGAPKRLEVFNLINGKRSTKEIARKTGRSHRSVLNDIKKMEDMGLIEPKKGKDGKIIKKNCCKVYDKVPPLKHVSPSYFQDTTKTVRKRMKISKRLKVRRTQKLKIPSENEILDICREGESQIYEFKAPGVKIDKITKEIAAFLHTKNGGIILYGVDDDGTIIGSDMRLQDFDQRLQNSVRNTIFPPPTVEIKEVKVLNHRILVVLVPPWDKETLYEYAKDRRYYIRKGTNVFALTSEELKSLARGRYVV